MTKYEEILQQYWGYTKFRPLQQEIIESVCEGKDTLGLMPTGGGKSITFQVATLSKPGICIVITPLIALMKDQVDNLKKRRIKAVAIYSGMTYNEIELAFNNCILGDYKFLYISPERLKTQMFINAVAQMKVNLIAVDESHCISQWGYDFRPSYLEIAKIREILPRVPILALTATATPDVVDDIQEKLNFKEKNVFSKSFERKNLTYNVAEKNDKLGALLQICEKTKGTGIVYVGTRKETKEIAYVLQQKGFVADFYHGGLNAKERTKKQEIWMRTPNEIMVSTNAFGMGIDKPDVRFVVHLNIPESLEAYFQEAGRAGRDEKESQAYLFFNQSDIEKLKDNFEKKYPSFDYLRKIYDSLGNYCSVPVYEGAGSIHDFDLIDFCKKFQLDIIQTLNGMKILEEEDLIVSSDAEETVSKFHFNCNRNDLYKFQIEHKDLDPFIKFLLRNYTDCFYDFANIYENDLARKANCTVDVIFKYLNYLAKIDVITYLPAKENPIIVFRTDRIHIKDLRFQEKRINERKERQKSRLEAVIKYVTNTSKCRSIQLLEYFGEKAAVRCGKCDVCNRRNDLDVSTLQFDYIVEDLKKIIGETPCAVAEILQKTSIKDERQVLSVIKFLLDNQKIRYIEGSQLIWNR
ncbi:MAG: RecQ family ATP-dependent DNA helicase [Bacteroidales bacterium]|nr:RecQ family ATP-dependent DNA helicase [Bacteroidales bacterium]